MKANEIQVGHVYLARVSGVVVPVRVTRTSFYVTQQQFWECVNTVTGRKIVVKSPQRFRSEVQTKPTVELAGDGARIQGMPIARQWVEYKRLHPGMMLLFRVGDSYESLGEDAEAVSKVVGITSSVRDGWPVCWFHHSNLERNLRKLLAYGHRVAICEQVGDSAGKPVERVVMA